SFRRGTLISAKLGRGNRGTGYMLRKPNEQRLLERISPNRPASYSFTLPARDEHGMETLAMIRNHGVNRAADALARSVDHILGFFATLRAELGFYLACLNLHEQLQTREQPTCFPDPTGPDVDIFSVEGLYDASLVFHLDGRVVGIAQMLMQAGCVVPARSMRANVAVGVFTHFKREEDATMTQGKLDEELS